MKQSLPPRSEQQIRESQRSADAVSYTHLDVYKRQGRDGGWGATSEATPPGRTDPDEEDL